MALLPVAIQRFRHPGGLCPRSPSLDRPAATPSGWQSGDRRGRLAWLVWMGPGLEVLGALRLSCSWPAVALWLPRSRGAGNVVFMLIGQLLLGRSLARQLDRWCAGEACRGPVLPGLPHTQSHAGRIGLLGHPGGQHPLSGSAVCSNTEYKHFPFVSFFCFGYIFNYKSRAWLLYLDRCLHAWGGPLGWRPGPSL